MMRWFLYKTPQQDYITGLVLRWFVGWYNKQALLQGIK